MDKKKNLFNKIKKYPYSNYSPNLIDYFLVLGYSINNINLSDYLNENNSANLDDSQNFSNFNKDKDNIDKAKNEIQNFTAYKIKYKPVVLNAIVANYEDVMLDEESIINAIFLENYTTIYSCPNSKNNEPINSNIIFTLSLGEINFNCFAFQFWDQITNNDLKIFIPKTFVIISKYPFFSFFSTICNQVYKIFKTSTELPLEIELFNIVNFVPSPINNSLILNILKIGDFIFYNQKNLPDILKDLKDENTGNPMILNEQNITTYFNQNKGLIQLSGTNNSDLNICQIFFIFSFESIIEIYLFSFLEFKMIFFSSNLETLNIVMYLFNIFAYPFVDNNLICSLSKENFLKKQYNNNIIGVNCAYSEDLPIPYKNYFVVNIKTQEIFFKPSQDDGKKVNQVNIIRNFLKNLIKEEAPEANDTHLGNKIRNLYELLKSYVKRIMNANINDQRNINFKPKFFVNENNDHNKNIQNAFYGFNMGIFELFQSLYKINVDKLYEFRLNIENISTLKQKETDKIFFECFANTSKYKQYERFLVENKVPNDYYQIPFKMFEYLINIKKKYPKTSEDYFQIINSFYHNINSIKEINFYIFYRYCFNNYNNIINKIYNFTFDSQIIKAEESQKKEPNKHRYKYKKFILDNEIIKKYAFYLNSLDYNEFENFFPMIKLKKMNKISEICPIEIDDYFEKYLCKQRVITAQDMVTNLILITYIINIYKEKYLFHFFEEIFKMQIFKTVGKICIKKYIYIILKLLINTMQTKKSKNQYYSNELIIIEEIINTIKQSNLSTLLDERCVEIINNYNLILKDFLLLREKDTKFKEEYNYIKNIYNGKIIDENYKLFEEGVNFIVLLQNNACLDKGTLDTGILISLFETVEYKGINIQTKCKTCNFKIQPFLNIVVLPEKSNCVQFYSLYYLNKIANDLLNEILNGEIKNKEKFEEDTMALIANLINYISYKEGQESKINNYLATILKD